MLIELDEKERAMVELIAQLQSALSTVQRQSRELRYTERRFKNERVGHRNVLELEHCDDDSILRSGEHITNSQRNSCGAVVGYCIRIFSSMRCIFDCV